MFLFQNKFRAALFTLCWLICCVAPFFGFLSQWNTPLFLFANFYGRYRMCWLFLCCNSLLIQIRKGVAGIWDDYFELFLLSQGGEMSRSNRLKSKLEKGEKAIGVWNEQSMENWRSRNLFTNKFIMGYHLLTILLHLVLFNWKIGKNIV